MTPTLEKTTLSGHFVRHDLMSTNPAVSETFFAQLFGWRVESRDMMGHTIRLLFAGDHRVGGILPLDAGHGHPSHWVGYAATNDVDAGYRTALAAGGSQCYDAMDMGPLGRVGFLNDVDGAFFHLLTPGYAVADAGFAPGTVVWNELLADHPEKAAAFYGALLGWTVTSQKDLCELGTYTVMAKDGVDVAGIMQRQPQMGERPTWLFYFGVADVHAARERVVALGGQARTAVMPIDGLGHFAIVADPTGAAFALFQSQHQV